MEVGGERCIAFLRGGEEDGYPFCVNTLSVVLIKCYYYISWFMPHSTPFFCTAIASNKVYVLSYLLKWYFVQPLRTFIKKKKKEQRVGKKKLRSTWFLASHCGKTTFNSHWHWMPPFHNQRTIYCCNSKQSVSNKPHIRKKATSMQKKNCCLCKQLNLAGWLLATFYMRGL